MWSWLSRRIMGGPQFLLHQSHLRSFSHSPSDLGYYVPISDTFLQLFPKKSGEMLVSESCDTRRIGAPYWGSCKCFGSYCFGCTCWHSKSQLRLELNRFMPLLKQYLFTLRYFPKTVNWSLLMSLFTFVPAASVFGSSWEDWRRIFAHTKPNASVDYMICLPAHGAVIGAWFGAWPMPLDWERPWQEWPICVSCGAMAGYLITMVLSFVLVLARGRQQHPKAD